jgi:predicted XRE-type DNA-binding protein
MANEAIKKLLKETNIRYWEVAKLYGVNDGNFSRILRDELPKEKQEKIFSIIQKLKNERSK